MRSIKCPSTKDFVPICDELKGFDYIELYLPKRTCMAILNKAKNKVKYQVFESKFDLNPNDQRLIECKSKLVFSSFRL